MIKAIIFDFGGVVKRTGNSCIRDIAFAYGLSQKMLFQKMKPSFEFFRKGLINENHFWKKLSLNLNKPVPKNKNQLWRKEYEKSFYIYPSIISFVKKLKANGFKTAILSNTIKPHVEVITKKGGYKEFPVVVLSCNEGLQKPERKIYLLIVKRLGVKPRNCIFIDNKKENLKPAKKLKMKIVLAKSPKQVIKDVSKIIKSLNKS